MFQYNRSCTTTEKGIESSSLLRMKVPLIPIPNLLANLSYHLETAMLQLVLQLLCIVSIVLRVADPVYI